MKHIRSTFRKKRRPANQAYNAVNGWNNMVAYRERRKAKWENQDKPLVEIIRINLALEKRARQVARQSKGMLHVAA